MIETLEGGCACGELRYRLTSAPMFVHCCHCLNCQRHTGSAFVINLLIETARIELLKGDPQPVTMPLNGGSPNRIFRCPACQVAVWSEYGGRSEIRFVRGGTLDQPSAVAPDVHIYTRSKLPWVSLPDAVPAFEDYYDPKTLWPAASLERRAAGDGRYVRSDRTGPGRDVHGHRPRRRGSHHHDQGTRLLRDRHRHPGPRPRSEHGALQRGRRRAPPPAALRPGRVAGDALCLQSGQEHPALRGLLS